MANFRPLYDRVLVKRIESEQKSAGGLFIPETAKEKPQQAEVIAVGTGLSMLHELGIEAIHDRVTSLGDRFAAGIVEAGCTIVSPRGSTEQKSGAVCFTPPGDAEAAKSLYETLSKEHATELASRCGRVRFAPHFYNTEEQVDRVVERVSSVIHASG